jgi:dolichyl-diphosphooligosaccharide--protein glycosyltransferase
VAEVLFSAITILFLILALKSAKEKGTSFSHIWSRDWKNLRKPLIYTLLTGLALGIYILSWYGGLLFVFIIAAYMIIQYIVDHLRGRSTDYLCIIGSPSFLIALIMIIPFLHQGLLGAMHLASLAIGALALLALSGLSRLMATRNIRRAYYPLGLAGLGLAGLGGLYIIAPSLLSSMVGAFGIFAPQGGALTISEVRPFLFLEGVFSLQPAWNYFTTNFFIAFISLGLIIYAVIKEWSAEKILFLAWSLIMLGALLGQVRFAYYFAVNVALLSGYFCWRIPGWISRIFEWIGFRERAPEPKRGEDRAKKKKKEKRKVDKRKKGRAKQREEPGGGISRYLRPRYVSGVLAIVVVFFLAFYPNIEPAMNTARHPAGPGEDWHDSLVWLRDNTPDPFEDPDFYYELYERPPVGEGYDYPESAYGVMSWWDYGHWIMRIAHRIPNSNPFQAGAREAALFFTAQDESSANELLDERGSKYVIIDFEMATTKFYAMAIWAGESQSQFFEVYYQRTAEAELSPIMLYYPEYYQSMCSRLYNFGGEAVVPSDSTWVISYAERTDAKGNRYKEITTAKLFSTYEEAKAFLDSQTSPNYRIVGADPFVSSVPLEELAHYELIHKSDSTAVERGDETISYVEIFEYTPY